MIQLVSNLFYYYSLILMIYALMSWFPNARNSRLGQIINRLVTPYLEIFDRIIPPVGGISFNVIIAIFVLNFIRNGLITVLSLVF